MDIDQSIRHIIVSYIYRSTNEIETHYFPIFSGKDDFTALWIIYDFFYSGLGVKYLQLGKWNIELLYLLSIPTYLKWT